MCIQSITEVTGDFSAKVGREDILKPAVGNEGLHKIIVMGLEW
jgi:hypothetical protein